MDSLPSNPYLRSRAPWTLDLEARARKLFLPPQIRARGHPGRWIWKCDPQNLEFAPPNPRSRAPWALDLGLVPKHFFFCPPKSALEGRPRHEFWPCDPQNLEFAPPKSALEGALGVGSGACSKIFFFWLPKSARSGRPRVTPQIFFALPNPRSRALWTLGLGVRLQKNCFFAPSNPRSRAPWTLDLEARPQKCFYLRPQIPARGRAGRWIWGCDPQSVFFSPPNPRSRAPWTLDLEMRPKIEKKINAERRSDVGMTSESVLEGALAVGFRKRSQTVAPKSTLERFGDATKQKQILLKDLRTLDSEVRPNQKRYFPPFSARAWIFPVHKTWTDDPTKEFPSKSTHRARSQTNPPPRPSPPNPWCPGL